MYERSDNSKPCCGVARYRHRAFSLIELVLVMAIIGVVSAIAMPRYQSATNRNRLNAAVSRAISDFELAHELALVTGKDVTIKFNINKETATITAADGQEYVTDYDQSPYHADIKSHDMNGTKQVVFNGYGLPNHSAAQLWVTMDGVKVIVYLDPNTGLASR